MPDHRHTLLCNRLHAREKKHRDVIENCQRVVDLMQPEMEKFEARTGHNLYAVRMAVEHESSVRTTTLEANELADARTAIDELHAQNEKLREALAKCKDQFTFYADEHERAGKTEKATTNRMFVEIACKGLE